MSRIELSERGGGEAEPLTHRRGGRRLWLWTGGSLLVLLGAVGVTGWLNRMSLAEMAIKRWCTGKGFDCEVEITRLGLNRIEAADLKLASQGAVPLEIRSAQIDYAWAGLVRPEVSKIVIAGDAARLRARDGGWDAYGLEALIPGPSDDDEPGDVPELDIRFDRVIVDSDYGVLSGGVSAVGVYPAAFDVEASLAPVALRKDALNAALEGADLAISWRDGVPMGSLSADLARLEFDALTATNLSVHASVEPAAVRNGEVRAVRVDASGSASAVAYGARASGRTDLDIDMSVDTLEIQSLEALLDAIASLELEAQVLDVGTQELQAGKLVLRADLVRGRADREITGTVSLEADGAQTAYGGAMVMEAAGDVGVLRDGLSVSAVDWSGGVTVRSAALGADLLTNFAALRDLPEPVGAHGAALDRALRRALAGFDTGAEVDFGWRDDGRYQVSVSRGAALSSESGLAVSITPTGPGAWLSVSPDGLRFAGDVAMSGGGAPDLAGAVKAANVDFATGGISVETGALVLSPWRQEGRTLGLRLEESAFSSADDRVTARALGEIEFAGSAFGVVWARTRVFGGVRLVSDGEGLRAEALKTKCFALSTQGISTGALSLAPATVDVCPDGGRILRRDGSATIGRADLGNVRLQIGTDNVSGVLALDDVVADWRLDDEFSAGLNASGLSVPLTLPEGSVRVDAGAPDVALRIDDGAPSLSAAMSDVTISGSIVPANLEARTLSFEGAFERDGVVAEGAFVDLVVSDLNADPLYEPLNVTGTYALDAGRLTAQSDLRLQKAGYKLGTASLDLDVFELNGVLSLEGDRLEFAPDRFQPADISDRVRGFFTSARGSVRPRAELRLTEGALSGNGLIALDAVGFDTLRVGSVRGVTGDVVFTDLVGLRTPPDQVLQIAELDPGVPLRNGELSFQLLGAEEARLNYAVWPFAGGELAVQPTRWTVHGNLDIITAEARQIELAQLVELLRVPDVEARGTASGSFPVRITEGKVLIENATLTADAGRLAYTGQAGGAAAQADDRAGLAFEALENFEFSVLELTANGNIAGNIAVGIRLEGRNPDLLDGQEFIFNISVDSPLAQLVRSGTRMLSGDAVTDYLVEYQAQKARERDAFTNDPPSN